MKRIAQLVVVLLLSLCCEAQVSDLVSGAQQGTDTTLTAKPVTLQACREMALSCNGKSKVDAEMLQAAEATRKAALASMFPKLSANAAYLYSTLDPHLISNQGEFSFGTATAYDALGNNHFQWNENALINQLGSQQLKDATGQIIADVYQEIYNKLSPDMTHIMVGQVGITQPIYVGGRLRELYKLSKSAEHIAEIQQQAHHDDIIVSVDEAYWRVVNVREKKKLAEDYFQLLTKLEGDVEAAMEAGIMTQSDLLSVRVKRSEAESKLMQATNGLILSKMALCQVCGLPLNTDINPDETGLGEQTFHSDEIDIDHVLKTRSEIQLLEEAQKMAKSQVKLAAAGLQPNIVASANYIYTNPNVEDGFSNDWKGKGFFSAGVVMNIPIAHADDIYRLKAAKHAAKVAELKTEEAKEMITLQATQSNQKVIEANQKLAIANAGIRNAEENLRFAQELFAAGMITTGDLMQVQTAWLKAHTDRIDAQVEVMVTEAYFRKHCGKMED